MTIEKKINDFGLAGDIYSAYETISPSESLTEFANQYFPTINLPSLYIYLNYLINKQKKDHFELDLKQSMGSMQRISKKIFRSRFKGSEQLRNAFFFFEDHNLDIHNEKNFNDPNFMEKVKRTIAGIKGQIGTGRPKNYILSSVVTEINSHLKNHCNTELKNHVVDSGNARSSNERFNGLGLDLTIFILKDFQVVFQSTRSVFDLIKSL